VGVRWFDVPAALLAVGVRGGREGGRREGGREGCIYHSKRCMERQRG